MSVAVLKGIFHRTPIYFYFYKWTSRRLIVKNKNPQYIGPMFINLIYLVDNSVQIIFLL